MFCSSHHCNALFSPVVVVDKRCRGGHTHSTAQTHILAHHTHTHTHIGREGAPAKHELQATEHLILFTHRLHLYAYPDARLCFMIHPYPISAQHVSVQGNIPWHSAVIDG